MKEPDPSINGIRPADQSIETLRSNWSDWSAALQQSLVESGLIAAEEMSRCLDAITNQSSGTGPVEFLSWLIEHGKLTRYQADRIATGQTSDLLLGNYLILDKIGEGGMGQVFKARHRRMKRIVAVKILPPSSLTSPVALERFHREIEAVALLEHPNIVTAYDADEAGGRHFLAMQFVEGRDLASLVRHSGPLSPAATISIIRQAAQGLAYAHGKGIVHRDVKPANLLVDQSGTAKVLDLGLARIQAQEGSDAGPDLTRTGAVMGTVDFMAPEQAVSTHAADERSDVYSLGCTLFYALTGRAPYSGDSLTARLLAHRDQPIPDLKTLRSDVSDGLCAVFERMVAKAPADRYASMALLIDDLDRCAREHPDEPLSGHDPVISVHSEHLPDTSQSQDTASSLLDETHGLLNARQPDTSDNLAELVQIRPLQPTAKAAPSSHRRPRRKWWHLPGVRLVLGSVGALVLLLAGLAIYRLKSNDGQRGDKLAGRGPSQADSAKPTDSTPFPIGPSPIASRDREVAEWVLSVGGKAGVQSDGRYMVRTKEQGLPGGTLTLTTVSLYRVAGLANEDLAKLAGLGNLSQIDMPSASITDAGVLLLKDLPNLKSLKVSGNVVTDVGLRHLDKFPELTSLSVGTSASSDKSRLSPAAFANLIDKHPLLETLEFRSWVLDDEQLRKLRTLSSLRSLRLDGIFTNEGLKDIGQLTELRYLYLTSHAITDEGLQHLASLKTLEEVAFDGKKLSGGTVDLAVGHFPNLRQLVMQHIRLTDQDLERLDQRPKLKMLSIEYGEHGDSLVPVLSRLKGLSELRIMFNKFTPEGVQRLVAALPNCAIRSDFGTFGPDPKKSAPVSDNSQVE